MDGAGVASYMALTGPDSERSGWGGQLITQSSRLSRTGRVSGSVRRGVRQGVRQGVRVCLARDCDGDGRSRQTNLAPSVGLSSGRIATHPHITRGQKQAGVQENPGQHHRGHTPG